MTSHRTRLPTTCTSAGSCTSSTPDKIPQHIGVMCDGNRRWAKAFGEEVEGGYIAGADKIEEFLGWCDQLHVKLVTLWLLSTDNLNRPGRGGRPAAAGDRGPRRRPGRHRQLAGAAGRRARPAARPSTAQRLKAAADQTADVDGMTVNIAVAYGGRRELADAVRSLLHEHAKQGTTIEELAEFIDVEHIAEHLYTKGQPDPDLVIRTSGEQRMSGLPALAERAQRVLLLRGHVARLPPYRLPARHPRLRRPRTPLRHLEPPLSAAHLRGLRQPDTPY